MPTYQYACTACAHQLEAVQSFADDPLTQCPVCEGRLRKLFGSVGIVFKGPGSYRTDSRAASNGNGDKGNGDKGSGDNKGGGGDKSKKPAESTESKPASSASGEKKSGGKELASSSSTTTTT